MSFKRHLGTPVLGVLTILGSYKLQSRKQRSTSSKGVCSGERFVHFLFHSLNQSISLKVPSTIGGLCGSVFLDMAFKRYLRTIVTGEVFDNIRPRQLAKMMYDFDHHIKRQFNSLKDSYPLDLYGVPPNPDIGMEDDGSIRLTRYVNNFDIYPSCLYPGLYLTVSIPKG